MVSELKHLEYMLLGLEVTKFGTICQHDLNLIHFSRV